MEVFRHTGLVADPMVKEHQTGPDHPESPDRYDAAFLALCRSGLMDHLQKIPCRPALDEELAWVHAPGYVDLVRREIDAGGAWLSTGDTPLSPGSWNAALYAVGGVINAVAATCRGEVKNAFALVRPPGHHAGADTGMGFCLFNNIALAARAAQRRHGLSRVVIVDWDVHHGNGTQDIFYEDGSVFYFSLHQSPWYPGTGAAAEIGRGPGRGTTLNAPLPAGAGRKEVFAALESDLIPAMEHFQPDFVLVSAGFDSRRGDPLGEWNLTDEDFADMTHLLLKLAARHAGGRLVSVLEGGYHLGGLASAVVAHVQALVEG
ncbi:MAG TPA: histone deacetylase [Kiritimatiellia bacterium]|mgnify:CR=1 FL=1|nr:histone deacetylase [Kiritimatiellia bacterium]HMO97583.1 histone deacetylase [Kiritimatiellia bacterium]HMP96780.1 histone deacetylase [Kiritimatiellia bacterium]